MKHSHALTNEQLCIVIDGFTNALVASTLDLLEIANCNTLLTNSVKKSIHVQRELAYKKINEMKSGGANG